CVMADTFVPLLPNVAATPESKPASYRLKIMPSTTVSETFKPIEQRMSSSTPSAVSHTCALVASANAQPVITLEREGDQVTHIRIQCSCGQVIELECVY